MKELFGFLVDKLKQRIVVDRRSKEDLMLRTVLFFARNTFAFVGHTDNANDFLREEDVARYLSFSADLSKTLRVSEEM